MLKRAVLASLALVALVAFSAHADARPPRQPAAKVAVCDHFDIFRGCFAVSEDSRSPARLQGSLKRSARYQARFVSASIPGRASLAFGVSPPAASWTGHRLVDQARSYLGRSGPSLGLPSRLWCADFANMLAGGGTGSRLARSYLVRPAVPPAIGVFAVTARRGGGHVGIVSGFTPAGDVILISGNHGHVVGEGVYSRSRVLKFVSPT